MIEYIPGTSLFHRVDPRVKLLYFLTILVIAVAWSDTILLALLFAIILIVLRVSGVSLRLVTSLIRGLSPLVVMYFAFNILFKHFDDAYLLGYIIPPGRFWFSIPLTVEGLVWSVSAVLRFLTILIAVRTMLILTPVKDMILSFIRLGLPPEIGVAIGIGFSSIPVLIDENRKIKEAQQARGWEYEFRNPVKRLSALFKMLVPTLMNSIRRSNALSIAIESRGFGYNIRNRTWLRELRFTTEDYWMAALLVALAITGIVTGGPGYGIATYELTSDLIIRLLLQ